MDDEKTKSQIGSNIATCRKSAGLTQAGLAEKLNYSDKAVSKWERGESVPDVLTLLHLSELFGVSLDRLVRDSALSDPLLPEPDESAPEKPVASKGIIQALSSTLVWFVALFFFVVISSLDIPGSWVAFVYAVPVNAIVLLSLRSAWRLFSWNLALISVIVWGCLASIFVSLLTFTGACVWKLFLLGIPGQIAIFLWFRMFRVPKKESEKKEEEQLHGE